VENFGVSEWTICNTILIYENFDDSSPLTDIVCGPSSQNWSYYRKIPATATEQPSSESTDPSTEPTGSETTGTSVPAKETTTPPQPEKKGSSAWIAGAVIGGLAGLALIGALLFFFLRRKKSKKAAAGVPAVAPTGPGGYTDEAKPVQGAYVPPGVAGYNPQDQYNQYPQEHPTPAPQYSAPYAAPGAVPQTGHYAPENKGGYQAVARNEPEAFEMQGSSGVGPTSGAGGHASELPGEMERK